MKIVAPNIEEVISLSDDRFNRERFGRGLLKLFSASESPLVVALDEKWGTGKTVFAHRFARSAREAGHQVIYFDAFGKDYDPDVFVSLAATVLDEIPKTKKRTALKTRAKAVGKILGRVALKGSIRLATAGAIRLSDISDSSKELATEASQVLETELDNLIDERLASADKDRLAFAQFRENLSSLSVGAFGDDDYRPVIFVVDELDRCRPDYALSVLEVIKHFFSVPSVHFLLLCDFDQLVASVRGRYGNNIDADAYLEKFVHARVSFPIHRDHERKRQISDYICHVLEYFPDDGENGEMKRGMADFIADIAFDRDYSLRRIERILTQFGLCISFTGSRTFRLGAIVFLLCDLKITNRILFQKAKSGSLLYREISGLYNLNQDKYSWIDRWCRYFYDESIDRNEEEWQHLSRSLRRYNVGDPNDTAIHLANNVVDRIEA